MNTINLKLLGAFVSLSLIGLPAEAAPLGFDNPGFEDTAKRGVINDCLEIGPFGVNGNGGLRVRPEKKSRRYVWTAPLAKGKTRIVALADGKGAYKVLVIGVKRDNDCTFTLPAKYGRLVPRKGNVKLEGDAYSFSSKEFTCDILD